MFVASGVSVIAKSAGTAQMHTKWLPAVGVKKGAYILGLLAAQHLTVVLRAANIWSSLKPKMAVQIIAIAVMPVETISGGSGSRCSNQLTVNQ